MDYFNNLLVGYSNKLKTAGVILGSVCVGMIGIVSAAFISYNLIYTTSSSTDYITIPLRTLSIISSTPNVTFSHISYDALSKNAIIQIVNATNSSNQYSWRRVWFNATVPINSSIFVDIYLPLEFCSNLTIYKYYNRTFQPTKGMNINSTTCSFSLNVTSDESDYVDEGTVNRRRATVPGRTKGDSALFCMFGNNIAGKLMDPVAQQIEPGDELCSLRVTDENGELGVPTPESFSPDGYVQSNVGLVGTMIILKRRILEDFDGDESKNGEERSITDLGWIRGQTSNIGSRQITVGGSGASTAVYTVTVPKHTSVYYPSQGYREDNDECEDYISSCGRSMATIM